RRLRDGYERGQVGRWAHANAGRTHLDHELEEIPVFPLLLPCPRLPLELPSRCRELVDGLPVGSPGLLAPLIDLTAVPQVEGRVLLQEVGLPSGLTARSE